MIILCKCGVFKQTFFYLFTSLYISINIMCISLGFISVIVEEVAQFDKTLGGENRVFAKHYRPMVQALTQLTLPNLCVTFQVIGPNTFIQCIPLPIMILSTNLSRQSLLHLPLFIWIKYGVFQDIRIISSYPYLRLNSRTAVSLGYI